MEQKWSRTMMPMTLSATMTCATIPIVAYADHKGGVELDPNAVVEETSMTVESVEGSIDPYF